MTETFWIAATILIVFSLAFVLYPVFFQPSDSHERIDLRHQNLMAYRSRMEELEREHDAGTLGDSNYHHMKEELVAAMLDDVSDHAPPSRSVSGRRSAIIIGVLSVMLLPPATYFLYQEWGAMDKVEQFIAMQKMGDTNAARAAQMIELTTDLRNKLEASPDNPDGWAMLGQSYMRLEKYQDAAAAYQRLAENVSEDTQSSAVALGLAAQALFFESQGAMTKKVTTAIEAARALNPDEVNVLGLLGVHAFSQHNYRDAIQYWTRIVEVAPNHPQIAVIRGGIEEAYQRLGEESPAVVDAAVDAGPGVRVRVTLADAFRDQVPADTTLFVFAKQDDGVAGPPLAIARLTAGDLPADVRLDDSKSMSPQAKISNAGKVIVTARLSRSGSAVAQAGDWQGSLDTPLTVSSEPGEPVSLIIDKQLTN
ncbi:MAG TPA: c-type cytochrome biogenesis protein CcmI [Marinobacter sp.]|nr:c-type cytochrome biogenesis protein CcmI [Marinobacter sp.]